MSGQPNNLTDARDTNPLCGELDRLNAQVADLTDQIESLRDVYTATTMNLAAARQERDEARAAAITEAKKDRLIELAQEAWDDGFAAESADGRDYCDVFAKIGMLFGE